MSVRVTQECIIYSLNIEEGTAAVVGSSRAAGDIIIPRSIIHDSKEYIVDRISRRSLKLNLRINSIQFAPDSEVKIIEKESFFISSIKSITLPSSLIKLEEEWFSGASSLMTVKVCPNNPLFSIYDNKLLVGKSSIEKENFDILHFCFKDVETITIPSSIEIIKQRSFAWNEKIRQVFFLPDSKLRIIEKKAFFCSHIQSIKFPPHLIEICEEAFAECIHLQEVEFSPDSELQAIGHNAFCKTRIEKISLPPHITKISRRVFNACRQLKSVEIPLNSEIQNIEKYAFNDSLIESIYFPSGLIELDESWCIVTSRLNKFEISPDNPRYKSYEDKLIIGKSKLENDYYDTLVFCVRNIKKITIPDFIEIIGNTAFSACEKLRTVEFTPTTKVQKIKAAAFCRSAITQIEIPSTVTYIDKNAFTICQNLRYVDIQQNSKLHTIEKYAFSYTSIRCFKIPPHVSKFYSFLSPNVQIVELDENSMIKVIVKSSISLSDNTLIMIPEALRNIEIQK